MHLRIIMPIMLIIAACVIFTLSLLPEPPLPVQNILFIDKIEHGIAYFSLSFLAYLSINTSGKKKVKFLFYSIAACSVYGGLIEAAQHFTGRSPEYADFSADILGSCIGSFTAFMAAPRLSKG